MKADNTCPFCGHSVIQIINSNPPTMKGRQAECDNCGARGPVYGSNDEALTGWNDGIVEMNGRYRKSN